MSTCIYKFGIRLYRDLSRFQVKDFLKIIFHDFDVAYTAKPKYSRWDTYKTHAHITTIQLHLNQQVTGSDEKRQTDRQTKADK